MPDTLLPVAICLPLFRMFSCCSWFFPVPFAAGNPFIFFTSAGFLFNNDSFGRWCSIVLYPKTPVRGEPGLLILKSAAFFESAGNLQDYNHD